MNHRPWVAAPLAGVAIALASPPAGTAAHATPRHAPASLRLRAGDRDHHHRNPWRDCRSHRRVILIDPALRAFLTNGRRGPEALVLQGTPESTPWSPEQPWGNFTVATFLSVNFASQTQNQYEFSIKEFFRVHPLFVVKTFDNHKRVFAFPAAHCNDHNGNDNEDRDRPHGGGPATSPSPRKDASAPREDTAAGWSTGLLSTQHILIAAGGLLMLIGMLATAWYRRRRSDD